MMKYIIAAVALTFVACDNKVKPAASMENSTATPVAEVQPINLLDSLWSVEGLNELETRIYKSGNGSELLIYNYKHSGDGVYELDSSSYGRLYTLRGDAENPDAVVYQLVPFNGGALVNLLYQGDQLLLLNDKFMKPQMPTAKDIYSLVTSKAAE